jgi:hypothetical protein
MKVILKNEYTVCLDGVNQTRFPAGEAELPTSIAAVLLDDGRASLPPVEEKALPGAPGNKMLPHAPKNKAHKGK